MGRGTRCDLQYMLICTWPNLTNNQVNQTGGICQLLDVGYCNYSNDDLNDLGNVQKYIPNNNLLGSKTHFF